MSLSIPYYSLNVETLGLYTILIIDLNADKIAPKYWIESRYVNKDDAIRHIHDILVADYEFVLYDPLGTYISRFGI